jgi:hypothetical protein
MIAVFLVYKLEADHYIFKKNIIQLYLVNVKIWIFYLLGGCDSGKPG